VKDFWIGADGSQGFLIVQIWLVSALLLYLQPARRGQICWSANPESNLPFGRAANLQVNDAC